MKRQTITKADLKAKSEALQIPFSNLLAGWVVEEVLFLLAESDFSDYLWLKCRSSLGAEEYRRKNILTLEYVYVNDEKVMRQEKPLPGQKLSFMLGVMILAQVVQKVKVPEIKWKGNLSLKEDMLTLDIMAEFAEMKVPVQVKIQEIGIPTVPPVRQDFASVLDENRRVSYLQYPIDPLLAELLFRMIRDMELITDLGVYERVYEILRVEALDGRHTRELLASCCRENGMVLKESRGAEIAAYKDYSYMKKRWERYLRSQKKKEPSWQEVTEVIGAFLPAIWEAVCRDEIFFGDWMPELGRFLD
jgi:hypothetical protein